LNPAQPSILEMMFPFLLILVVFYFFIIRPQSKRMKQQESFLKELKRGDAVVTQSGIFGVIDGLTDQVVTLDLGNGLKIKMLKRQIAGSQAAFLNEKK
jgi:preprotein translocase subunit YajC